MATVLKIEDKTMEQSRHLKALGQNLLHVTMLLWCDKKNVRLTHNSTPDVRRGRGCVIKVDWGMLRELRV